MLFSVMYLALFGQSPIEISGSRTTMHFCLFAVEL